MATKKVNLVISLKDGVSAGIEKIGSGLKKLGVSFKQMATVAVAGFAAVGASIVALGKAFAEQEAVNSRLASAFNAVGENGQKAVEVWGAWATEIQRTTTLGDEEIMNLVSLGKVMGVTNDKLAEATKGAIGLSKAFGIDMNSSMKMVALAMNGEYEMLQRYIPELRKATTAAEKHAIVQDAMVNGFKMAEDELDTMSGQWKSLQGVIGDAMQEAGGAVGEGGFTDAIKQLKESIIDLSESGAIKSFASAGAKIFSRWIMGVTQLAEQLGSIYNMLVDLGDVISETKNPFKIREMLLEKSNERAEKKANDLFEKALEKRNKMREDAENEHWDKMLAEQKEFDKKTGFGGAEDITEKVSATKGIEKVAEKIAEPISDGEEVISRPSVTTSTTELFRELSKGRSFEGATSALSQVTTAMEGETIKKVASLLEDQNKILNDRLGGVSS